ncbi:MAG: MBL fold metallo-hydrolase [Clostridia bacterium]|nr:MBL fold metallo-hydrolase [Clostridia bacterium]
MFRYGEMYAKRGDMKQKPWIGKMEPFRVIGNVYFVGTYQASCHLIDTGEGLIMIDPGYAETAYLVIDSIHRLGFDPRDIRYVINTHWHGDHTGATAAFADLSGAKTLLGREDAHRAEKFFTPDMLIDDGDTLTLGNTTVRFLHTPGHTKGTISFFFDTREGDKTYRVGSLGGAGLNTLARGHFDFDGCREAYQASLERLKTEKVDVFIGNHTWNNDTYGKSLRLLAGGNNEFIDDTLWLSFLEAYEKKLQKLMENDA